MAGRLDAPGGLTRSEALFVVTIGGGRSRSVTYRQKAFFELRYQLRTNGVVYTTVIPFGADPRGADTLTATLVRLESARISQTVEVA